MQAQDAFQDRYAGRHAEALALAHALCAQLEDPICPHPIARASTGAMWATWSG